MTPSGRAPVMATLRVASATLSAAPSHGSSAPTAWFASVEATRALVVPLTRRTAAPWPGPTTVFVWTVRVVLVGHPAAGGEVRAADEGEQDGAGVHAPLRQALAGVGPALRRAGRRRLAAARRRRWPAGRGRSRRR